jgi:hypothetical protein
MEEAMKMLLVLATATLLTAALAQYADPAAAGQGRPQRPEARRPGGLGPDLVRGIVRRAVGFDRLQRLLSRGR